MYTIFASLLAVCILHAQCSPIDFSSATSTTSSTSSQLKLVVKNSSEATNYHLAPIFTELENMEEEIEDDIKAVLPFLNFLFSTLLDDFIDEDDECSDEMVIQLVPDLAEEEEHKKRRKPTHHKPKTSAGKKKAHQKVSKSKITSEDVPHIDNKAVEDTANIEDISSNIGKEVESKVPQGNAKTEEKSSGDTSKVNDITPDASDSNKALGDASNIEKSSKDVPEKEGKVLLENAETVIKSSPDVSKLENVIDSTKGLAKTSKIEEKSHKDALETPKIEEKSSQGTKKVEYIVHDVSEAQDKISLVEPKVDQVK